MNLGPGHFGVYGRAKRSSHVEAIRELTTLVVLTAIPFVIGLVSFVLFWPEARWEWPPIQEYLGTIFLRGQLFLVAASFVANALYRLFSLQGQYRRPDMLVIFSMLLFGVIGIYYGRNPSFAEIESNFAQNLSILFLVVALLFHYYLAVLANEKPPSVTQSLNNDTKSLSTRLAARRSTGGAE